MGQPSNQGGSDEGDGQRGPEPRAGGRGTAVPVRRGGWGLSSKRTESRHYPKQVTKPAKKQSVAKLMTFATGQLRVKFH